MPRSLIALLVIGAAGALAALVAYRAAYGNWAWQGDPERLGWCDRVYNRDAAPVEKRRTTSDGPLYPVFRAPPIVGSVIYSEFTEERASKRHAAGEVCGLVLFRRAQGDTYITYSLSGGP
jgi:hypothetical protein